MPTLLILNLVSQPAARPLMNRRIRWSVFLALPAVLLFAAPVHAQNACSRVGAGVTPGVAVCVNGQAISIPAVSFKGKVGLLPTTTFDLGGGASFYVGANFNSDPFSIFTFGSIIPGGFGSLSFDAYFTTPVIGGPYNFAHSFYTSSLALTSAVGAGPSSGTISNGTYPTYLSGFTNLGSLGVDVGTGACTLSVPSAINCPPGDQTNTLAPITPTFLTAHLSYTHSTTGTGASSSVAFVGGVEISDVTTVTPEPATIVMMSFGLLVLGGIGRQKRKAL